MFTFLTVLELLITPRELIAVELCVQGPRCRCLIKTYILSSFAKKKRYRKLLLWSSSVGGGPIIFYIDRYKFLENRHRNIL